MLNLSQKSQMKKMSMDDSAISPTEVMTVPKLREKSDMIMMK